MYQQSPPADLEPTALVKYLARYVSGVAISDKRLVSCERGQVTFTVKNRNEHGRLEERTISVTDFLSRFLQHVLPSGFTRVRYYGIYSTGNASLREHCRELLLATASAAASAAAPSVTPSEPVSTASSTSIPAATAAVVLPSARATALLCAVCHQGVMRVVDLSPIPKWKVRCAPLCQTPSRSPRLPSPVPGVCVLASPVKEDSS